jgi:hypothetical protein
VGLEDDLVPTGLAGVPGLQHEAAALYDVDEAVAAVVRLIDA